MGRRNLTKASVEAFSYDRNGPSRQVLWDGKVSGFGCRATPAGGKQYVLSYRFNGRPRLMSLGPLDHFETLDKARAKARALLHGLREKGIDPLSTREQLSEAPTIALLWQQYWDQHVSRSSANTRRAVKSLWESHLKERIGYYKPTQVQGADLVRLHDRITREGGEVVANRAIQRLRALFNWARDRDEHLFPSGWRNPAERVTPHRELPRTHHLNVEQMRALAEALEEEPSPWVRVYVALLMLTGARKDEIRCLRWADVDLERRVAVLAQTKNGKPMTLPLAPVGVELLRSLPVVERNPYVFPEQRKTAPEPRPMIEPRRAFKAALRRAGLPQKTTFHDLRRSYGTALARQGASAELVARALNNTSTVAAKVYIQIASDEVRRLAEQNALTILPGRRA